MLVKNPENRISLTNILTHRFIIKNYADENKDKAGEESKSQNNSFFNLKNQEEKKNRKKNWKKSLTQQNDSISYNDTEGIASKLHNDFNPKFQKSMQTAKTAKSAKILCNGSTNLMPPGKDDYQKLYPNKMLNSSMNDSNFLDALENHDQLKSVLNYKKNMISI